MVDGARRGLRRLSNQDKIGVIDSLVWFWPEAAAGLVIHSAAGNDPKQWYGLLLP